LATIVLPMLFTPAMNFREVAQLSRALEPALAAA